MGGLTERRLQVLRITGHIFGHLLISLNCPLQSRCARGFPLYRLAIAPDPFHQQKSVFVGQCATEGHSKRQSPCPIGSDVPPVQASLHCCKAAQSQQVPSLPPVHPQVLLATHGASLNFGASQWQIALFLQPQLPLATHGHGLAIARASRARMTFMASFGDSKVSNGDARVMATRLERTIVVRRIMRVLR